MKLKVWCEGKDWCPITATATLIGRKWHPVILHRLLENGGLGYNELKEEVDGISDKVLSDSLDDLEDKKLVQKNIINEEPLRVEYMLTDKGNSLENVIEEMKKWGQKHLTKPDKKESSLNHKKIEEK